MIIECKTFSAYMDTIEVLVKKGLTFVANSDTFTIELTWGY